MYTDEFKEEIVKKTLDPKEKKSMRQIGIEYGIDSSTLGAWRRQYLEYGVEGFSSQGRQNHEKKRTRELEKELEELREENEILKKAAAFFAKTSLK